MGFVLRLVLGACAMWLAANVVYYPSDAKAYVHPRFQAFHQEVLKKTFLANSLPPTLVLNASPMIFQAAGVLLGVYALLLVLGLKCWVTAVGALMTIVGILLHLPCAEHPELDYHAQFRKLLFVLAFFCASMAIPCSSCTGPKKPEPQPAEEPKKKHS